MRVDISPQDEEKAEVLKLKSFNVPFSNHSLMVLARSNGSVLLYDVRTKKSVMKDQSAIGQKRWVTAIDAL